MKEKDDLGRTDLAKEDIGKKKEGDVGKHGGEIGKQGGDVGKPMPEKKAWEKEKPA